MNPPKMVLEEVTDPVACARVRGQLDRARRNDQWLEAHRADVFPQARGKFLAVAGQEAFIAKTSEEAWAWAEATHPEDDGALVRYVSPEQGPYIYASNG